MKKSIALLGILILFCPALASKPLSMEECVEIALKNNTYILNSEADLKNQELLKTIARSNFLPSIGAGMGYSHSRVGSSSQVYVDPFTGIPRPANPGYTARNYSSGLNLNQTIYDGGYSIANFQKSELDVKAAGFGLENTRQQVIYSVEETYVNLLRARHLLDVYRETIRSSEEALKKAESMEEIGAAPHSDVLKARVKYEQDRMALIEAENNIETTRAYLNYILGFDVNRDTEVEELPMETGLEMKYEQAVEMALENHPSLKQFDCQVKSAKRTIRMAKSSYMPQFSSSFNYSWNHEDFGMIDNMFDEDYNWSARLNLSLSLFDGFSRPANVSRAKVGYRNLQDRSLQNKRDVMLEVKSAYLGMSQAKKKIEVANESVISAEEDLKHSSARYQLGAGIMLEQIDSQVALTYARVQLIQAQYDYRLAVTRLKKAVGKL